MKADKEKDRKVAGAAFLKQMKRLSKTAGAGEDDLEAIMEAANKLVELSSHAWCLHTEHTRMRTWKKKVFGCGHSGRIQATPAKQRPSPYSGYAGA